MDARPCFDPTGKLVLFMRQPLRGKNKNQIWFYSIPTASANPLGLCRRPDPFYVNPQLQATRPDWSWTRNSFEIAFSGNSSELWLLDAKTKNAVRVDCTAPDALENLSYPSWTKDDKEIVLTNCAQQDLKRQRLLRSSTIPETPPFSVQCTDVTKPDLVWPGMSSVSPSDPDLVAFAGQTPNLINTYD
jgi:hypothetical protein